MPARVDYSGSDMLRMQRDAQMRVQQMRDRARAAAGGGEAEPELNRNWSSATGRRRQFPTQPLRPPSNTSPPVQSHAPAQEEPPPPESVAPPHEHIHSETPPVNYAQHTEENTSHRQPPQSENTDGTILGDVMGALGMEDDTLLIIGLLLILLNQKADTTLLLALAYLLI